MHLEPAIRNDLIELIAANFRTDEVNELGRLVLGCFDSNEAAGKRNHISLSSRKCAGLLVEQCEQSNEVPALIKLVVDLPHDLPAIVANPQQIQQVFLNIINNARYALNEKYPQAHEDKVLEITGEEMRTEGMPHVRIAFHDRGTGIPAELLDRVMMPFFSTKPGGKGTGLGLCISHGIVSDHGGTLDVESMEGEFTRATVILPAKELAHGDHPHH